MTEITVDTVWETLAEQLTLERHTFESGKVGFSGQARNISINGDKYWARVLFVKQGEPDGTPTRRYIEAQEARAVAAADKAMTRAKELRAKYGLE